MKKQGKHRVRTLSPQCGRPPYSYTMVMSLSRKKETNSVLGGGVGPVSSHLSGEFELWSKWETFNKRDQVTGVLLQHCRQMIWM